jgi:hypothetical protein
MPTRSTTSSPADEGGVDAARGWKTALDRAPGLPPAGLIFLALADRATRRLHAMLSKWARERAGQQDLAREGDRRPHRAHPAALAPSRIVQEDAENLTAVAEAGAAGRASSAP